MTFSAPGGKTASHKWLNFRRLAITSSLICVVLAMVWAFIPGTLLAVWEIEFSHPVGQVGRRGAVLFVGIGVMFFCARNAEPSLARSALSSGFIVGCLMLAALGIYEFAASHAGPGILSAALVEIALALAFLYVARTAPSASPK